MCFLTILLYNVLSSQKHERGCMDQPRYAGTTSEPHFLGGNIALFGFHVLDPASMIVLKKIIGNYARRFSDNHCSEKLELHLTQHVQGFALLGSVRCKDQLFNAEFVDKNVFFVVDAVLKQLEGKLTSL